MSLIIFILGMAGTIYWLAMGDFGAALGMLIAMGLVLWVWQAICDGAQAVTNAIPREQYNLTQNRYDLTESDDPTRPNENIPAVIEIGRHYTRKP